MMNGSGRMLLMKTSNDLLEVEEECFARRFTRSEIRRKEFNGV